MHLEFLLHRGGVGNVVGGNVGGGCGLCLVNRLEFIEFSFMA